MLYNEKYVMQSDCWNVYMDIVIHSYKLYSQIGSFDGSYPSFLFLRSNLLNSVYLTLLNNSNVVL